MAYPLRLLVLFGLLAAIANAADRLTLDHIVGAVRSEVRPGDAMDRMRRVYSTDRWFTFPKFHETTNYVAAQMKSIGLQNVEILGAPADGKTQAGFWTMPLAWDVRKATLEVVEPRVPEDQRMLADYLKIPASLGMWSGPTEPGGLTAELVELKTKNPSEVAGMNLKGKIVVGDTRSLKSAIAKAGAIGAINTFTENPSLRDGHQWMNAWGDNGWGFTKDNAPLLSFSISPRKTELIRALLAKGPVKVKAVVDTRYYEGVYPYATGVIRGLDPREEVLVLGHAAEQGAHDNATGVAVMLEALASINRLITAGKLERPKRSIRLLVMGELYGSMDYVAKHPERMRNTVAAMCLDAPAGSYEIAGTEYSFYMNPHVAASWVDALILKVAATYFPLVKRSWHEKPFTAGTDTFLSDPMIGVPTTWAYSGSGVETHHNSEDTPNRVDERSLRDISIVTASFLYYAAMARDTDAQWLGELTLARAYDKISAAGSGLDPLERIRYISERQKQAMGSIARVAPGSMKILESLISRVVSFESEQIQRVEAAAGRGVEQREPRSDAPRFVVTRMRFGSLPLDDLPEEKREGYPSGAWSERLMTALYWCDGQRPLDEVIRLTRLELGPDTFDYAGYFRFLARHGYVKVEDR
ncbi:MAG TPA: M28 family peptidase [Bryobacteraceae bacterium]|nr:M28 family peptidase [Bryobacteraceae bacterium]